MSTVQQILGAMDKLTRDELRILKLGVDSRLADDDNDPALLASLKEAIAYADAHPSEAKSIDEIRALIPNGFPSRNHRPGHSRPRRAVSYIARDNPEAAKTLGENLLDTALSLTKTPFKGSRYQKLAYVRKLTLPPFKIFYRVNDAKKTVEILRFWHSARREPKIGTDSLNFGLSSLVAGHLPSIIQFFSISDFQLF
jgi:toxin ParE1/3/4